MLNCRLSRNISLSASGSGCGATDMGEGIGGIMSPIYVYNIGDVNYLRFTDDNRADDQLSVDEIVSSEAFYSIDFSEATYNETYEDGVWTHTLTLTASNIRVEYEKALADAVGGRYLVSFRPYGSSAFRMFGWRNGASLSYTTDLSNDAKQFTITITDQSEYPLMRVSADNFDVRNKVYTPVYKPDYNQAYCETVSGVQDGYVVARYVPKTNNAGQALDEDNKLCQWSGKKQDAYKLQGQPDGDYRILGTYTSGASYGGLPVRIYDPSICNADIHNSITLNQSSALTLNMTTAISAATFTLNSYNNWNMESSPRYVDVSPNSGGFGEYTVNVTHRGEGGTDRIVFQNHFTQERVTLTVNVNMIKIASSFTFSNGTTEFLLCPVVEGGSQDYTYTVSPSLTVLKDSSGNLVCSPSVSENEQNFTFVLTHRSDSRERVTVSVKILGNNTDPSYSVLSSWCEME